MEVNVFKEIRKFSRTDDVILTFEMYQQESSTITITGTNQLVQL